MTLDPKSNLQEEFLFKPLGWIWDEVDGKLSELEEYLTTLKKNFCETSDALFVYV